MVDIVVIRGEGDRPGQDIVNPLLSDLAAAIARGTAELDEATDADRVSLTVRFNPAYRTGQLVEVLDSAQGAAYRAQIRIVTHTTGVDDDGNPDQVTSLTLWRPRATPS